MSRAARKPSASARRTAAYRERLRAKGLKPVTIWVPDRRDPEYLEKCRRAVAIVNAAADEAESRSIDAWVEAAADWSDL